MIWHLSFNNPASKTVNKPVGPAPMISISVSIIIYNSKFLNSKGHQSVLLFAWQMSFLINNNKDYDFFAKKAVKNT